MHTIDVEDDVYMYLVRNTTRLGEDASSILRRLLDLPETSSEAPPTRGVPHSGSPSVSTEDTRSQELAEFVTSPRMRAQTNVTDKFLLILSFVHQQNPEKFSEVIEISGRTRTYFGRSRNDLTRSGKSIYPQQIPESPYWAMTNASTAQKRSILRSVLDILGYNREATRAAATALR